MFRLADKKVKQQKQTTHNSSRTRAKCRNYLGTKENKIREQQTLNRTNTEITKIQRQSIKQNKKKKIMYG
jgi:hypothetical protein